jgi:hypothetical protein
MKNSPTTHLIGRVWPLVVFSLPGVIAFGVGLAVAYQYSQVQLANPGIVWEGTANLSTTLMVLGMLSFFAGLIMGAVNDVRGKADEQLQELEALRRLAPAGMAFEGGRFYEQPQPTLVTRAEVSSKQ